MRWQAQGKTIDSNLLTNLPRRTGKEVESYVSSLLHLYTLISIPSWSASKICQMRKRKEGRKLKDCKNLV